MQTFYSNELHAYFIRQGALSYVSYVAMEIKLSTFVHVHRKPLNPPKCIFTLSL